MLFARNVHFNVKKDKHDEFKRIFNNDVLPVLRQQNGFKHELTLTGTDRWMGISVWQDRASAEAYAKATYPKVLEKLTPVLDGTPKVETCEVGVTTLQS